MKIQKQTAVKIFRDAVISLFIYALPVLLLYFFFSGKGQQSWKNADAEAVLKNLSSWGLPVLMVVVGLVEFAYRLYDNKWNKNERVLDIVCFVIPKVVIRPLITFFVLKFLPVIFPGAKGIFSWVPFGWAFLIIAIADDLTQYWYHRLHHQVPWLWRFHRTHHSAPYMGMAMASRQNVLYTIFFSQIYLTAALTYLGLGYAALFVTGIKSLITLGAHSSIPWDKPFYKYKVLHPVAWVLERLISTPATHHAHHADTADDGVGNYKGNFGNMFFLWDVIFGTGIITRQYPQSYGIKHYKQEEWYAQFLWPIFKSKKAGSELAANGPMVGDELPVAAVSGNDEREEEGFIGKYAIAAIAGLFIFASTFAQTEKKKGIFILAVDSFAAKISRQTSPQIIDVRTPEEFALNHLNGAINIDLRGTGSREGLAKFSKEQPVFLYAIQHSRPDILAKELRENGYKEVYELQAGIASWIGAGYPYYTTVKSEWTPADYKKIITTNRIVLVDIGTRYCGLCTKVKELVDSLKKNNDPSYTIVELELYKNPQLVADLKEIEAVPTVILYKDGKPVWKRTGLSFTKGDIEAELAKAK